MNIGQPELKQALLFSCDKQPHAKKQKQDLLYVRHCSLRGS